MAFPGEKGFVGGTIDASIGLTTLGARQYDPTLGRFISVDPIMDLTDPQQMHGYTYSNNTPITKSDPTGLKTCDGVGGDWGCAPGTEPVNPSVPGSGVPNGGRGDGGGKSTGGGGNRRPDYPLIVGGQPISPNPRATLSYEQAGRLLSRGGNCDLFMPGDYNQSCKNNALDPNFEENLSLHLSYEALAFGADLLERLAEGLSLVTSIFTAAGAPRIISVAVIANGGKTAVGATAAAGAGATASGSRAIASGPNAVSSAAGGRKLAEQLRLESANSLFTPNGGLTSQAINESQIIIRGKDLGNQRLRAHLTRDGSEISDWSKYTTKTHHSPYGNFQVHYYYNPRTGVVAYDYDYKVVMNAR